MKKVAKIIFVAIAILSIAKVGISICKQNSRINNPIVVTSTIDDGNSREGIFIL